MNLRGTQPARWAQVAPRWPSPALCGRQSGQAGLQAFALAGPEWLKTISIAITRLMLAQCPARFLNCMKKAACLDKGGEQVEEERWWQKGLKRGKSPREVGGHLQ